MTTTVATGGLRRPHVTATNRRWPVNALLLLVAAGVAAWVYEVANGLATTGMRDVVSWGLYVFTFAFFVGLSAGGLIMASSAEVFGVRSLRPLGRLGILTAAASIAVAALMIIPDLGRPGRIFNIFRHPHWTSPLVWDLVIVLAYLAFAVVDLVVVGRGETVSSARRRARLLAYVGLPMAVLLHSVTAWIFGLQIAHAWWNTALMAPLFVTSAILSGTALVALVALLAQRYGYVEFPDDTKHTVRVILATAIAVDLFLVGCDYITIAWGNVPRERAALDLVLPGGSWQWLFWLEWVVGGVAPFALLVLPRLRRLRWSLPAAAGLVLVGVYAFRIELVVDGLVRPLVQLPPGIAVGTYRAGHESFQLTGVYSPTWVEYLIVVGLVAAFAWLVAVGCRRIRLRGNGRVAPRAERP
jgi:molybdopterin-containing oxidoreductase family membrane subunit